MVKQGRLFAFVFALILFASTSAFATPSSIKVLFLGYEYNQQAVDSVRTDILGTDSRFDHAGSASWDGMINGTPTLATLSQYDSVLVWTNYVPDTGSLGDLLADYVDAGGHVVLSTFWGQEATGLYGPSGRINSTGYNPFVNMDWNAYSSASLGTYNSSDPLFQGVTTLSASNYRGDYFAGLDTGATLAGSWSDGKPLAGYNASQNVVGITLFPNVVGFGHASGDYQQLFRNGLALNVQTNNVPEPVSMSLLGIGGLLLGVAARMRKKND